LNCVVLTSKLAREVYATLPTFISISGVLNVYALGLWTDTKPTSGQADDQNGPKAETSVCYERQQNDGS